jgi:hypothetical protein
MKIGVLLPLAGAILAAPLQADALFSYSNFNGACGGGLTCVGTATVAAGALQLTPPGGGLASGAAYDAVPVTLGTDATFSTTFQFQILDPGGINPADGFAFVISAGSSGLGGSGGQLGYSGVPNSVAIEFDIFNNGTNDDNSSNHIAIDEDGHVRDGTAQSDQNPVNVYGQQFCDFSGLHDYSRGGCMSNGDVWSANIGFNGSGLTVSVWDQSGSFAEAAPFTVYSSPVSIDIASLLGTSTAYIGFTSADASGWAVHDILNWTLANDTELAMPEPQSLTMMTAAGVFFAVVLVLRRRKSLSTAC